MVLRRSGFGLRSAAAAEAIGAVTGRWEGIRLGRTTYQMFEPAWSARTVEDDPSGPLLNDTMKYVVSGSLTGTTWRNGQPIGAYDPGRIRALKDEVGDLYVSGSGTLGGGLLSYAARGRRDLSASAGRCRSAAP